MTSPLNSHWCQHPWQAPPMKFYHSSIINNFFLLDFGSVWIELILLNLKTENWKHCSKIIFKSVNSTVGPIFNEKVAKKCNLWVRKQYTYTLFTVESQHLRLLFNEQCMNSNCITPKLVKKKKKKGTKTQLQNADAASVESKHTLYLFYFGLVKWLVWMNTWVKGENLKEVNNMILWLILTEIQKINWN